MSRNRHGSTTGFTLLELSVVLVLIAIIIGGGLSIMTAALQASQYNTTVDRMDKIDKALLDYAIGHNRLPCPADLTLTPTNITTGTYYNTNAGADYGQEAGSDAKSAIGIGTGVCTGTNMTPQANFVAAFGAVEGGLPTRALQLPDEYMYDGWGRRFRYAVDPAQTKTDVLPAATASLCSYSTSAITVQDASGANRTTTAAYALISHGANGHGAYTSNGVALNAGSVNANELTNCHCNSSGVAATYTPTYVEMVPMQDASNALDSFDDIVTFKEPWQLQAPNYPLKAASCTLLAVASGASPYLTLYSFSNGLLTKLPAPVTIPGGRGYGVNFSSDNQYLAWAGTSGANPGPTGLLYSLGGASFTYASTVTSGNSGGLLDSIKFANSHNYLAESGDTPRFQMNSGSSYVTTGAQTFTPSASNDLYGHIGWSSDDSTFYISLANRYLDIYSRSGDNFTELTQLDLSSYGSMGIGNTEVSVHPSGNYIAMGVQRISSPYSQPLVIMNPTTSPVNLNSGHGLTVMDPTDEAFGVAWSPDGTYLAAAMGYEGLIVYSFDSSTSQFTRATISGGNCSSNGKSVAWSKDGNYIAVACQGSPPLILFNRSGTTFTNMNINNSLMPPGNGYGVAFTH